MNRILTRIRNPGTAMFLLFLIWTMFDNRYHFRYGTPITLIVAAVAIATILIEGRRPS
jgi:hypothetical protein